MGKLPTSERERKLLKPVEDIVKSLEKLGYKPSWFQACWVKDDPKDENYQFCITARSICMKTLRTSKVRHPDLPEGIILP